MKFGIDPHPLERSGSSAILLVCLMQMTEVALMLAFPSAGQATSIIALLRTFAANLHLLAGVMIGGSALAVIGTVCRIGWARLMLLLPQHFLLGIMALGGIAAAFDGSYLDGTVMPWPHIAADQLGVTVLFAIHSVAIVKRARDPNG